MLVYHVVVVGFYYVPPQMPDVCQCGAASDSEEGVSEEEEEGGGEESLGEGEDEGEDEEGWVEMGVAERPALLRGH